MAISDAYATAAQYRDGIKKTDTGDDTVVDLDLIAISRYIERRLSGRFFNVDASDVTRILEIGSRGSEPVGGWKSLWLDADLSAAPTSIKIDKNNDGLFSDETALASTDYELHPLNALVGPEAEPYTRIDLTPWGDESTWPHGLRVEIIGKWGWLAVPDAIVRATIQLTAILRLEGPRATNRIPDDLAGAVEASPAAQSIVRQIMNEYRRKDF